MTLTAKISARGWNPRRIGALDFWTCLSGGIVDHIGNFHSNALIGPYSRRSSSALSRLTFLVWALAATFIGGLLGFVL